MKKPGEKGASAVEFALLLPVLVLLIFGIVEGGLILYDQAVITNASREGARMGILFATTRPTEQQIQDYVESRLLEDPTKPHDNSANPWQMISFSDANPDVIVPTGACASFGSNLTVTVNYDYSFLVLSSVVGLFGDEWAKTLSLSATTTMRCE